MKSNFYDKVSLSISYFISRMILVIRFTVILLIVCVRANAAGNSIANGSISGMITDSTGTPLIGVTVMLEGAASLTKATDNEGKFVFNNLPAGNYSISFTYVGYMKAVKTVSLAEGQQMTVNTSLLYDETNKLNDIVVIGYGAAKAKDVTGSVASVKLKDQEKTPIIGTSQLLEGQVSGVQVTQNQSQPGGSGFSVRIRGTNSINSSSEPLYVIDGYAGGDVAALNPSDIASIDVLKDGSATAIYGSRGANGVIIITTKRGRATGKSITVDAYTGVQNVAKTYNMLDAKGYATYLNRFQQERNETNGTQDPLPYTQDQINALDKGTNWQDEIFRPAQISNVSIGFNGGNADSKYYLSLSYFDQKGIITGSDYKRGIVRFNLDQNISKKITVGFSSQLSYDFQQSTTVNTSGGAGTSSVLWDAVRFNPILPVKDTNGYTYVNGPPPLIEPLGNPVAYANEAQDDNYNLRAFVNAYGEYEVIPGLKLRSSFGVNYNNGGSKYFVPTTLFVGATTGGFAMQSAGQNYDWLNENTITYNKNLNANNVLNVVGGFTFQRFHNTYFDASIGYLSTDILGSDNLGVGTPFQPSSDFGENVLASYFARANYSLIDKYLFTVTMRADGSSRFGANDKYGYFPSGAFAWRLSEEPFIKNVKAISDMKLRLSYGVTGNQEIGSYNSLSRYVTNSYSLGRDPQQVVSISPDNIANPNLKWESTTSYDGGLDISLFNQRLNFTGDYYYKKTTDLLLNINIPQTSGYGSYLTNIGAVENKGFEFSITSKNIDSKNVRWNTTLNFSRNRNKVLSLGSNTQIFSGDLSGSVFPGSDATSAIIEVGKPIGSFYGYVFDGIWQTQDEITKSGTQQPVVPGDPRYKDLNGDGFIDGADRTIIGYALPDFTYGINNEIAYKGFTLTVFFQGVSGNNIFNENRYEIESGNPDFNKLAYVLTESWNGPNTSNTLPKISSTVRRSTGVTSDLIENGSFLRLKTLNLSYNIPVSSRSNVFKSATVYVTAQNLVTFTKYNGYDPEVNSFDVYNQLSLGTDYNAYPNYRTFLFGVKLGF